MTRALTPLGHGRVYRDPRTGELVVDADTIRRTSFAGDDFGNQSAGNDDDDFGGDFDDDFGGDDFEGEDDDFGADDDFEGEDDVGAETGDEVGRRRGNPIRQNQRRGRRQRKQGRRQHQHSGNPSRRHQQRSTQALNHHHTNSQNSGFPWGMTAVSGSSNIAGAGAASVTIRLQHNFKAKDITFEGSEAGAKVTSIFFGDRAVWSNSSGIPVTVFGSSSFMRNLLKGQSLEAGLDIVVNGSLTGAGLFSVTILGFKPVSAGC